MSDALIDFEKLGAFYLGRAVDPSTGAPVGGPLLYDSRDLATHATIVGMTGSGKTGLGVALLEEAAIDGVPALVIDPKGDLTNLALTFPELAGEDFRPYVRLEEAELRGVSADELAAATAKRWRDGLATWGQDGERIRRLRQAAEVAVYAPGSTLGRPVSILSSFSAPPEALRADPELLGDRVETAATSLLALAGIDADPLRSREHILVATLLSAAWKAGRSYDLAALIADLQKPPVTRVGVLDLEAFYPAPDRFALALRINNLLAAPGFETWLVGEPLDLDRLLRTPEGRPRLAVVSLAHLSEAERMFFVSLLLNETVAWMRTKSGTGSLRALLFMDEVFGYLPPVANPPSKKPMLTLLKQARAYGLGLVLATQNPVDLDYKALGNIGTWFLGRLQTERDKARVLDGLEGAAPVAGFDRKAVDGLLSGLKPRVFVMRNVHEIAPVLFETRWVMSYLAGPLDREQLRHLPAARGGGEADSAADPGDRKASSEGDPAAARAVAAESAPSEPARPPALAVDVGQVFLPFSGSSSNPRYRPGLLGEGRVFIEDARKGVSATLDVGRLAAFEGGGRIDWLSADSIEPGEVQFASEPVPGAEFEDLPSRAQKKTSWSSWERSLGTALGRSVRLELLASPSLGELSRPGEAERDFRIRLVERAREVRDERVAEVRETFAARFAKLDERIRRAEAKVETEKEQVQAQTWQTVLSGAASVAGMLLGRRALTSTSAGRIGSTVRSYGRRSKEARDVERAEESVEALRQQRSELERALEAALAEAVDRLDPLTEKLDSVALKPKRSDVEVRGLRLAWVPVDG